MQDSRIDGEKHPRIHADSVQRRGTSVSAATAGEPKLLAVLRGHTNNVMSLALSADHRNLVSGSFDKTVRVWDVATGQERLTLRGHERLIDVATITPDGKFAMSADQGGFIKVWDLATRKERHTINTGKGRLQNMILMADGSMLACPSGEHTVELWNSSTRQKVQVSSALDPGSQGVTGSLRQTSRSLNHSFEVDCLCLGPTR